MNKDTGASRRRAHSRGHKAETWAALLLRLKGYRILARRYKTPVGEIDLIVRRGRVVAFVEVKARADQDQARQSITARQRHRIARAATHFIALNPGLADADLRFDAVLVSPGALPTHLPGAWRAE